MTLQLAISYASENSWIATDLHDLLVGYSYSIYCYDRMPDETRGNLRDNLRQIYEASWLNILLWSEAYAAKPSDSFVAMERRFMANRHVNKGDLKTLLFILLDKTPPPPDFELIVAHRISDHGLLGCERLVIERLRALAHRSTSDGVVFHPPATNPFRSMSQPCRFRIDPAFAADPLNRWANLADVLVQFPNEHGTQHVYLIPSGHCTAHLRHTDRLRTDPRYIEAKRAATLEWVTAVLKTDLSGFWFLERKRKNPEREVVTVYCAAFDRYLNENLERHLPASPSRDSTAG